MLNKMRQNLKADLVAVMKKANEQSLQQAVPTQPLHTPPTTTQPILTSNIQRQLTPHVDLVVHRDIENLTGMTSDPSPFQGALVDVLALAIPVHIVDVALHRIEEERIQSVTVMTSDKMIAPTRVQHGSLLGHLNLQTHLPGTSPHTNKTGRHNLMTNRDAQSHIGTRQIGRTGMLGANGETSHQICCATDRRTDTRLVTSQGHGSRLPT